MVLVSYNYVHTCDIYYVVINEYGINDISDIMQLYQTTCAHVITTIHMHLLNFITIISYASKFYRDLKFAS